MVVKTVILPENPGRLLRNMAVGYFYNKVTKQSYTHEIYVSHLVASLPTSRVRTTCPKLSTNLEQALNTTCNKLVDIIRLVARLFQQVRYSHDITILLQPCVVNLVTFLLYHNCIRLVKTTL
jgi:hypothetical protein